MATGLQLGDRVRLNETCPYQELIGSERFVVGMSIRKDATINVWLADLYHPKMAAMTIGTCQNLIGSPHDPRRCSDPVCTPSTVADRLHDPVVGAG